MDLEKKKKLLEKKWLYWASYYRPKIAMVISQAMNKDPNDIIFLDNELTKEIADQFCNKLRATKELTFPNRSEAINLVIKRLGGINCRAALLQDKYEQTGAIELNLTEAITHINTILTCQMECFRVVSWDNSKGACIIVEEGSAPYYPRYVTLW